MNYRTAIDATYDPVQKGSKTIRTDVGSYTKTNPYMTSKYNAPTGRTMSQGYYTNGTIKMSYQTRTTDQTLLNIFNMAFVDSKKPEKLILRSLQSVNQILASDEEFRVHRNVRSDEGGRFYEVLDENGNTKKPNINAKYYDCEENNYDGYTTKVSKEKIMDRFMFLGTIHNNDKDTDAYKYTNRKARGFTVAVKGATHLLDYWSNSKHLVKGYSQCFLILKQVKVYKNSKYAGSESEYQQYTFQTELTRAQKSYYKGLPVFEDDENFRYIWQFVPFFNDRAHLDTSNYVFKNCRGELEIGSYIKIGNVHEYPQLTKSDVLKKRNETSVARDVAYMHENGTVVPFQFYLNRSNKNILH